MTIRQATKLAKQYSAKYLTFWYVRQIGQDFEPWAHDSGNADTIACFYCGEVSTF